MNSDRVTVADCGITFIAEFIRLCTGSCELLGEIDCSLNGGSRISFGRDLGVESLSSNTCSSWTVSSRSSKVEGIDWDGGSINVDVINSEALGKLSEDWRWRGDEALKDAS